MRQLDWVSCSGKLQLAQMQVYQFRPRPLYLFACARLLVDSRAPPKSTLLMQYTSAALHNASDEDISNQEGIFSGTLAYQSAATEPGCYAQPGLMAIPGVQVVQRSASRVEGRGGEGASMGASSDGTLARVPWWRPGSNYDANAQLRTQPGWRLPSFCPLPPVSLV